MSISGRISLTFTQEYTAYTWLWCCSDTGLLLEQKKTNPTASLNKKHCDETVTNL